ncbi:MAG: endonuclease V [Desulfurococcales archaeon]|nr:endonuclease V [Desulfurococcales archaeon]
MRTSASYFSAARATKLQRLLAEKIVYEGNVGRLNTIIGLDLAYVGNIGIAVATLLTYPDLKLKEYAVVIGEVNIPYVPGLLAFREAPLMFKAYDKLGADADLIVVDGHGITHPRKLGIASHIGLVLDKPSIGAAKKILTGKVIVRNGREYLVVDGVIGALVLRPTGGKRAIFLSIGHKISIAELERIAPTLFKNSHYLPEPTYVADKISKQVRSRVAVYDKRKSR